MSDNATGSGPRYHALDCVRATAMLLGVFYHAIQIGMLNGGLGPGTSRLAVLSSFAAMEWFHSFRMPLFFLISGFFCHMMLGKYGLGHYLARRWWRIGAPFLIAFFVLNLIHVATRPDSWADGPGRTPAKASEVQATAPVKPAESKGDAGSTTARPREFKLPGDGGSKIDLSQFAPRIGPVGRWMFGGHVNYFTLGHLWFLWYLLIFATLAPLATRALGWLLLRPSPEAADRVGRWTIRCGIVPLALGLLSVPALMQTKGLFGWTLGMSGGIFGVFPDVLFRYQVDMPFHFAYFLTGWWLYRLRDSLPEVGGFWWQSLVIGLIAYAASTGLSVKFATKTDLPYYNLIRVGGYALYSVASAYLGWGLLSYFQRFLDRPTRVGRYLADTAFWVYLTHQEILIPLTPWIVPLHLYWWAQALLASALATAAGLVLFEIAVRPTPLNRLFGAASSHRKPKPAHDDRTTIDDATLPSNVTNQVISRST